MTKRASQKRPLNESSAIQILSLAPYLHKQLSTHSEIEVRRSPLLAAFLPRALFLAFSLAFFPLPHLFLLPLLDLPWLLCTDGSIRTSILPLFTTIISNRFSDLLSLLLLGKQTYHTTILVIRILSLEAFSIFNTPGNRLPT